MDGEDTDMLIEEADYSRDISTLQISSHHPTVVTHPNFGKHSSIPAPQALDRGSSSTLPSILSGTSDYAGLSNSPYTSTPSAQSMLPSSSQQTSTNDSSLSKVERLKLEKAERDERRLAARKLGEKVGSAYTGVVRTKPKVYSFEKGSQIASDDTSETETANDEAQYLQPFTSGEPVLEDPMNTVSKQASLAGCSTLPKPESKTSTTSSTLLANYANHTLQNWDQLHPVAPLRKIKIPRSVKYRNLKAPEN